MLLNLRTSVNWRLNAMACLCGVSLLFSASSTFAQSTSSHYNVGASEGVWVEAKPSSLPEETAAETITYENNVSALPQQDSATALQYDSSGEVLSEVYADACDTCSEQPAEDRMVVKNKDFFGVDREKCRDEWADFCRFKDINSRCGCRGSKAKKGETRRGIFSSAWRKATRDSGDGCDECSCSKEEGCATCR